MTFEKWATGYLVERGMFENQAAQVVEIVKADNAQEAMSDRWTDDTEGYPKTILAILAMALDRAAVEYIDANIPQAWFRPIFAGGA